ncbi:FAD-dependent oxidoreductase [Bradyrhizobium sp. U87765 SZCCT0131]|uniref:FAD-dependent oxidoreductase n=1 Tax=unclassified Bradyrhizobium TaxID=2631580 RepID=UPI001BAA8E7C|nr:MULTISPECIES: FAD-dependent oxidoreductase [unclassified Bradyrhizobium]MBR1218844.1 FAD-dependent oxidoreductase [Bradyrhizobium sp. U87765 SZCCT0131]MBR1261495.1 FAD-dependent oxidoreductase [Bradyrhizobium sp. U87765 SZCCT0134]MBR1306652.1 FAD-dependent oxidoreductase [Bradyrhizobium sp. U87765 SZCCT0110]MBR1317277.1 FAD-dependent oxidoreductase [Bradyrhizobium sp. U87765 SZCCT0109]MBR1350979.1 FAD-dependent oxidoreductase [Bradyrhizobium sp. U87765 SZCCT0048]
MVKLASRYDVVVAGGGSAGVAAAIGAARSGARTLLVERYGFLGGAITNSNVPTYCGFFRQAAEPERIIGGVGAELLQRLAEAGQDVTPRRSKSGNWIVTLDVEVLKVVLDELTTVDGLDVVLHAMVTGAQVSDGALQAVTLTDHVGTIEIAASAFVDASGEADLATRAGLRPRLTRGGADGVYPASFPIRVGGIADPALLTPTVLASATAALRAVHPDLPLRDNGGIWWPLPAGGELWCMAIDLDVQGADCTSQSDAERLGRKTAHAWLAALRKQPGLEQAYVISSGPQVGIRESRHVEAEEMVTAQAAGCGERRADGIARAGWPMEVHAAPGRAIYHAIGGDGFFDVPYGALCARGIRNLWLAGRNVGSDALAYGSLRVMGTAFATGHAAGVAAARDPRRIAGAAVVREALQAQGALV